jgi:drug/metabolite transporter (DMT)-like permease
MTLFIALVGVFCVFRGTQKAMYLCRPDYPRYEEVSAWQDVVSLLAAVCWIVASALLIYNR